MVELLHIIEIETSQKQKLSIEEIENGYITLLGGIRTGGSCTMLQ